MRNRRTSCFKRCASSGSFVVSLSTRRPSSGSACLTRFWIAPEEDSNFLGQRIGRPSDHLPPELRRLDAVNRPD